MSTILKAENISKQYRLGNVGTGTLSHDLNRWWHQIRGKEDPYLKVGGVNDRSAKATEDYVWALRDINFEVKQGEVLGIIGKNGAGKSTLLKILSRVTAPTTGSIKTKGRIASLLEVGTGFHGELTGRENIFMNGAVLGMNKQEIRSKLDEIIAFSGCEKYIDTPVKRYSSGMTVRLGFAVAAHLEPEILVVDEVLAVGDAEFQKKAIGKMQDLSAGEGRTVLFVSHNMASIQNLCTQAILIEIGSIKFKGNASDTVSKYLSTNQEEIQTVFVPDKQKDNIIILNKFKIKSRIRTGERFEFQFDIYAKRDMNSDFAIGFTDFRDTKIFQIFSGHSKQGVAIIKGNNRIVGSTETLPLTAGEYKLAIWIGSQFQEYQFFSQTIRVYVEEGELVKGIIAPYRQYPVISKSNWKCL
jgi:lipopolysaccharide transport system ATP-binding protein